MGSDELSIPTIANSDLPAILDAADSAARAAKRNYYLWTGVDLALLVAGTLLLSVEAREAALRALAGYGAAICLIVSLASTVVLLKTNYDKVWYGARAVAETVKTLSWKYMTCTEPFAAKLTNVEADEMLIAKLMSILSERKELFWLFDGDLGVRSEITETMRRARALDFGSRKQMYLDQRINDQRKWYGGRARKNRSAALRWLYGVIVAQLSAIAFTLTIVLHPEFTREYTHVNWAHVCSAAAIAFLAWMQLKQNHELAQAYGVAAHELGLISEQISHVKTEQDLSRFVAETESSISREHTMWMAKRERFG